jgi:hypothetical protein
MSEKYKFHPDGGNLIYQYHLTDHQGNVRMTFTTKDESLSDKATYEAANVNVEQSKFLRYATARRINAIIFDKTNGASTGYSQRLNGSANEQYGLAKSLSVMPGDVINAEVYAKYVDPAVNNSTTAGQNLLNLLAQIAANTAGVVIDGSSYGNSTSSFPTTYGGLQGKTDNGAPRAYLNWLIFDRNYVFQTGGFKQITTLAKEAGTDVLHEYIASPTITITQPGYVYIYLSNESMQPPNASPIPIEVYFDDFKVTHTKTPVVQSNDHFAHGMDNSELSYQRENSVKNNFLYNAGSEVQGSIDQNIYDMPYRGMDVSIGRMMQVDPMADTYSSHTTYNYAFNDPVFFNDPNGADPNSDGWNQIQESRNYDMERNYYNTHGIYGDDDMYGMMFGRAGTLGYNYGPTNAEGALRSLLSSDAGGSWNGETRQTSYYENRSPESAGLTWYKYGGSEITREQWIALGGNSSIVAGKYYPGSWVANWNGSSRNGNGPPTIFVNVYARPKGFSVNEYITGLKKALVANGFSSDLVIEQSSISGIIKAWWNNSPTGTITIKNFRLGQDPLKAAAHSPLNNSGGVTVLNGLSATGAGKSVPMWMYINATIHEIGHGFFGFNHASGTGLTNDSTSIMDYRSAWIQGAGFNGAQQVVVMESKWGKQ